MTTDIKERKRCIMMTGFLAVLWAAAAGRCAMIFLCGHIKLHKRDAKARGHVQHCPEANVMRKHVVTSSTVRRAQKRRATSTRQEAAMQRRRTGGRLQEAACHIAGGDQIANRALLDPRLPATQPL